MTTEDAERRKKDNFAYTGEKLSLNFQGHRRAFGTATDRRLHRPESGGLGYRAGQYHPAPAERAVGTRRWTWY